MSLYILGRIVGAGDLIDAVERCASSAGAALRRELDPEDELVLSDLVPGDGTAFAIVDKPGDTDATGLWNEAMTLAFRWQQAQSGAVVEQPTEEYFNVISKTALGRFSRCLASLTSAHRIGIAFVEGGIESSWYGTAEDCYRQMAWEWRIPWDQAPGRLYVWSPSSPVKDGSV